MPNTQSAQHLVGVVQTLSLARTVEDVAAIVRREARQLTGADGATFVLRDGDHCHYVDEDAIAPLWKDQHFPMSACISGWAMLHREAVVVPDIYADERIPLDAYRPTFVHSLVMMPIRTMAPLGAVGVYWAAPRVPDQGEVHVLQALADSTAVAMENVAARRDLESRVADRTVQLSQTIERLEQALAGMRTLRGLIPMCAHCKGIRDEHGEWHTLEHYLSEHTPASFSHGICPACFGRYGLDDDKVQ